MNIRLYTPSDRAAWDRYVLDHSRGTFFHLVGWKTLIERSFGHKSHYLLAESPGSAPSASVDHAAPPMRIRGIFPLFAIKSLLFGRSMVSVPFATYGGILADNDEIEQALLHRATELTCTQDLDYLEIRNESQPLDGLPVKDLYYVFKKEFSSDHDENLKAIPRKTRRMVRLGMKNGLTARFGGTDLLDAFYELFALSYHNFGTPVFSKRFLKNILDQFKADSSILVISNDGKPLSGVLTFYYKDHVIPYYSGSHPDARQHAANDYLYWALMSDAAEKGYKVFDFGRSKKGTGPYDFKRHWGFEPAQLQYQYFLSSIPEIPNISPANPKYQKRIEAWKKLPLWATKIIGPQIVKYIP